MYAHNAGRIVVRIFGKGNDLGIYQQLNVLLITADDLNYNSVGAYGCTTPGNTPNIDRLAEQPWRTRFKERFMP